jgi:hypothetical protein
MRSKEAELEVALLDCKVVEGSQQESRSGNEQLKATVKKLHKDLLAVQKEKLEFGESLQVARIG